MHVCLGTDDRDIPNVVHGHITGMCVYEYELIYNKYVF